MAALNRELQFGKKVTYQDFYKAYSENAESRSKRAKKSKFVVAIDLSITCVIITFSPSVLFADRLCRKWQKLLVTLVTIWFNKDLCRSERSQTDHRMSAFIDVLLTDNFSLTLILNWASLQNQ